MNEEQIKTLLHKADNAAGRPAFSRITAAEVRRRIHRRRISRIGVPLAAAAVVAVATALLILSGEVQRPEPQRIASLEEQVKQLQARTDATLQLVQEVLESDRRQRRLAALEAELASIPDPLQEIEQQVDKTAFLLIYQADRLYKELNQTESAVAAYKEVIQLFPDNRWAQVAKERLAEIGKYRSNQIDS